MTTIAYFNNARETFVQVRDNGPTVEFLTMQTGTIDVVVVDKLSDLGRELKPAPKTSQNLGRIAEQLSKSVLPKTPRAIAVLALILANQDKTRTDFVTEADANLAELNSKARTHKVGAKRTTTAEKKAAPLRKQEGFFALADLVRELGMNPREVRAQFRKAKMAKPEGGWVFPNDRREEITALVKGESAPAKKAETSKKAAKKPVTAKTKSAPKAKTSVKVDLRKAA